MGSSEEERLFQMVHDFIESESTTQPFSPKTAPNHCTTYFTLLEILTVGTHAETQLLGCVMKHMKDEDNPHSLREWVVMRLNEDGYDASLCQTSWDTTLGCPKGDYEYIDVMMEEDDDKDKKEGSMRVIVDIDFKSQFELARPTTAFKEISETLPPVFVGDEQKLKKIVCVLCSAAKRSLRARGLHIPPWRTQAYMMSKWFSQCLRVSPATTVLATSTEEGETKVVDHHMVSSIPSKWSPPMVNPKKREFGGGSGLSRQFSKMSTECC